MALKLIYEPSVYVIGAQLVDDDAVWAFLNEQTDNPFWKTDTEVSGQELVEIAGRTCYMSFARPRPGGNAAYIKHILESGHGSVLEHAVFTFVFAGISRSLSHELVRHRAGWAFSQLSQRYVDECDVAFVVPPALADDVKAIDSVKGTVGWYWLDQAEVAQTCYRVLSKALMRKYEHIEDKTARLKLAREAARSVLPNCTETKVVGTANVRALRHFIELRGNAGADREINILAIALLRKLWELAPNFFDDYVIDEIDGREVASTPFRKV